MGWELNLGFYHGIMIGLCSQKYNDGVGHYAYFPFFFICLDIFYDN